MPLASEDKSYIRDLLHEVRDVQKQTNVLLEEIRDLLKSPPVSGKPDINEILLAQQTTTESRFKPGDTFSSLEGGRDLPKTPPGTFWFYRIQDDRYILKQGDRP